jgi:hypothetical protein
MVTHAHSRATATASHSGKGSYARLAAMALASFLAMYVLMYAMVNTAGDIYPSFNQLYMAGLMAAPMVTIELLLMKGMYPNRRANVAIHLVSLAVFAACFLAIRQQAAITDRQFLQSMIPHHSGAILMCEKAPLQNPEIVDLCQTIIAGQQREIDQMRAMLQAR